MSRAPISADSNNNSRPPFSSLLALLLLLVLLAVLIIAGYLMHPMVQGLVITLIVVLASYCVVDLLRG